MPLRALVTISIIGALVGCSTIVDFDNSATLGNSDKYLAFIGEKIQIQQFDPAEDGPEQPQEGDEDTIIIYMDAAFKARYRVLDLVHGDYDGEIVDFKAYDHYGFPPFAKRDVAMIYLSEHEGALYHVKYQFDEVFPTADGRYAGCGDPYFYLDEEEIEKRPLEDINFVPPVVFKISDQLIRKRDYDDYTEEAIAENRAEVKAYYTEPNFEIRGDRAVCKKGVYPDELFRIMAETYLLPAHRRELCAEKLGIKHYVSRDSEKGMALDSCIREMTEAGLP